MLAIACGAVGAARVDRPVRISGREGPVRIGSVAGKGGVGARLCATDALTGAAIDCFEARANGRRSPDRPDAEVVPLSDTENAVLFGARDNLGGSGSSNFWALLVFGANGKWNDLLPAITISEQSDHLYWSSRKVSRWGIFSVADYIADEKETHFGLHRLHDQKF